MVVIDFLVKRFEADTINGFLQNVDEEILNNEELIREWEEDGVDDQSIICQQEYGDGLTNKFKLYKGILTYDEVKEIKAFVEKKTGEKIKYIFDYELMKAANIEALKELVYDAGLGCCCGEDEEYDKMFDVWCDIKNITEFRKFLKEYDIFERYTVIIYKKHLISFL